jgi:glycine dehydrogenase subunit 1
MNHPYLPLTDEQRREMLAKIGVNQPGDLFTEIPEAVRLHRPLNLPPSMTEPELKKSFAALARENSPQALSFLGAGAYQHYIPAVVDHLVSRSEFYTAYTPYQPEFSQGVLQAIFEYQTYIAELFGLPLANASLYDGPTALAEAIIMAVRELKNQRVFIPLSLNPFTRKVIETYTRNLGIELITIPENNGVIDSRQLEVELAKKAAAVVIQNPNFFGLIEDLPELITLIKSHGAVPVCSVHPLTLGLLESPGRQGAEIVVGEGQPLGLPLSYGGPFLGLMAVSERFMRKIPGRLVGETVDQNGKRAFVLTLQTREQHIRREKATSNICTNQALCALRAAIYLSVIGPRGIREIARRCYDNAHYLYSQLRSLGLEPLYDSPFFMEFIIKTPKPANVLREQLLKKGILAGLDLSSVFPPETRSRYENTLLICATEVFSRKDLDTLAAEMRCLL